MKRRLYLTRDLNVEGIAVDEDAEIVRNGHAVSYPSGSVVAMEPSLDTTYERDENTARLNGLMAVLALPAVRCDDGEFRRVPVEVEVSPGLWARVETIAIDADGMTFTFGTNGRAAAYHFPGDTCPKWRTVQRRESRPLLVADP